MPTSASKDQAAAISKFLGATVFARGRENDPALDAARVLCDMIDAGLDRLSLPGDGQTLLRWRALAAVAACDLSLAKLYEAHTDALAILAEARADIAPLFSVWGVWCAEPPQARLSIQPAAGAGAVIVDGVKAWCSGANVLTHAIVSGWNPQGEPCLAAVDLDQPGIVVSNAGWHAVGMAGTASVEVRFRAARGQAVGGPGFYTSRPGFWHGAAGIAACWHGAAAQLASYLHARLSERHDPHALAHLGRADVAMSASAWGLRTAAQLFDAAPAADGYQAAMRARLATEQAADAVMRAFGRALGATPFCRDGWCSRMLADLPVFLRQSHAERDLAMLGQYCLQQELAAGEAAWRL